MSNSVQSSVSKFITKEALVSYLDDYLAIHDVPDYKDAYNGLQIDGGVGEVIKKVDSSVEENRAEDNSVDKNSIDKNRADGRREIRRVALAVDACLATITQAVEAEADLLIVHHGLFWGAKAPVTGMLYRRLALLITNDLPLYSCHTPLDAHPEVGNNAVLTRLLGLQPSGLWGEMEGVPLGVYADTDLPRTALVAKIRTVLHVEPHLIATGPEQVRRLGVVTGAAGTWVARAKARGIDTLLTGEGPHHTYFDAEELGLNLIYAGHYATETVGLQALATHLTNQFGLETVFIEHPTGL